MKHWRTTLFGLIAGIDFIVFAILLWRDLSGLPKTPWAANLALVLGIIAGLGLILHGFHAADKRCADRAAKLLMATMGLLAVFCGCASAEPPDHNDVGTQNTLTVAAPYGVPVDGIVCLGAMHTDTNWTSIKVFSCTNGQYMAARVGKYDEYTAFTTNSGTGRYSDYAPKVMPDTNGVVTMPVPSATVTPN